MFNTLLESKPKKEKHGAGTIFSVVLHTALIIGAVYVTAQAAVQEEEVTVEEVKFVEAPKEPPPPEPEEPPPPPPPDVVAAPPPPKGFQVLSAPVEIPDVIPEIDLTKQVTDEADFSGKGAAGGTSKGVEGGVPQEVSDQPYFEFQVEKPVAPAPGNPPPRYPDILSSSRVAGEVVVQFVVTEEGRADMSTFKVLKSDHDLFAAAVKNVLPRYKFLPAEIGGRKVKQLVQLPFQFTVPG